MIFPWQTEQWKQLLRLHHENRLPHALLLHGMAGTGKAIFADYFSRALLCKTIMQAPAAEKHITECHTCRLLTGHAHQDVLWIEPEKAGHAIKVDQVRAIVDFINQSSLQGEHRLVIINPANNMNASAANALLKTLEEPAAGAILILISDERERLPATVRSRCQQVIFPRPQTDVALQWLSTQWDQAEIDPKVMLHLAQGAPLHALNLMKTEFLALRQTLFTLFYSLKLEKADPLASASSVQDEELVTIVDLSLSLIVDLLRLQVGQSTTALVNADQANQLIKLKETVSLNNVSEFMDYLQHLRKQICLGMNLNKQLTIESVLIRWMECT